MIIFLKPAAHKRFCDAISCVMHEEDALMCYSNMSSFKVRDTRAQAIEIFEWDKCCNNGCKDKNVHTSQPGKTRILLFNNYDKDS